MKITTKITATGLAAVLLVAGMAAAGAEDAASGADGNGLGISYELFEDVVPHIDLEQCPDGYAGQDVFCRLTLAHDQLNLVVFSAEGEQPMIATEKVDLDKTELVF
ncbi:hypothetical protein [Pontibaca methylaminivorans]|uniref:hypothetical protein n=1 Tax=Pontibaca methylaminivorans TaxID=515897 RepID=UPI002FD964F8